MKKQIAFIIFFFFTLSCIAQKDSTIRKKDRKRDVLLQTNNGDIVVRLSDSTPLHRDNFLKLVKTHYYDSVLFHRVIRNFMIQGGDPNSKHAAVGEPLGNGGPAYRIPAEFRQTLFHKKGVIAAARDNNPEKASSGSQFYIVQGKVFSDAGLDSVEIYILNGRWGPYIQKGSGKDYYKIPKTKEAAKLTLEECLDIIANAPEPKNKKANAFRAAASAKKTVAKKAAPKKTAAKKTTTAKAPAAKKAKKAAPKK